MLTAALRGVVERYGLQGKRLGDVIAGAVMKHSKDFNLVRECVLSSGLDPQTPGLDMQRACGTSLEAAIRSATRSRSARSTPASPAASTPSAIRRWSTRAEYQQLLLRQRIAAAASASASSRSSACARSTSSRDAGRVEPRTGLSMGESCEQMAKTWQISARGAGPARLRKPRQRRGRPGRMGFHDLVIAFKGLASDNNIRADTSPRSSRSCGPRSTRQRPPAR
jgi:acetyl-CoA C-acetyltransferase